MGSEKIYLIMVLGGEADASLDQGNIMVEKKPRSPSPQRPYIWSSKDGKINGFSSEEAARRSIEEPYQQAHLRSYEGSMSACIHWMLFRPRIVAVDSADSLRDAVIQIPFNICQLSCVAGFFDGIRCDGPGAMALYENGVEPKLIDVEDLRERATPKDAKSAALSDERGHSRALAKQLEDQRQRTAVLEQEKNLQQREIAALEQEKKRLARQIDEVEKARQRIEDQLRWAQGQMVLPE